MTNERVLTYLEPPGFPPPVGNCCSGIKVRPGASFIFLSGLAPLDDEGKGLVGFDAYTQTVRVMEIMKKVVQEAGATLDDIVNMHVSLTDPENWERSCDAYSKYFDKVPTVTLELVSGLIFGRGQLVQIDAVAAV